MNALRTTLAALTLAALTLAGLPAVAMPQDAPTTAPAGEPSEAPAAGALPPAVPAPGRPPIPVVKSREDFEALSRDEQELFLREKRPAVTLFFRGRAEAFGSAEFDSAPGSVSTARVRSEVGFNFRLSRETDFVLRFTGEYSGYDFDDAAGAIPGVATGELFDDVYTVGISPVLRSSRDDGWDWLVGGQILASAEPGADFGDSIVGSGFAFASYQVSESLRLGGGLVVTADLDEDLFIVPIPVFEWQITERLTLASGQGTAGLTYDLNDDWIIGVRAQFERVQFRLDDDGPIPAGSVVDRAFPVGFEVTYTPNPRVVVTGIVGAAVGRELEISNEAGVRVTDLEADTSVFGGFSFRVAF